MLRASLLVAGLAVISAGCYDATYGSDAGDAGGSASDAATPVLDGSVGSRSLRIDPARAARIVTIGAAAPVLAFRALEGSAGAELDVTGDVRWSSSEDRVARAASGGVVALTGEAGRAFIRAELEGLTATATVEVEVDGELFLSGTGTTTRERFERAELGANPVDRPVIEQPLEGVVLPPNVRAPEIVWSPGADSDAWRVRFFVRGRLDVSLYTPAPELIPDPDLWARLGSSAPDEPLELTIEGVGPSSRRFVSLPRHLTIVSERIEAPVIFHHTNTGGVRAFDLTLGESVPIAGTSTEAGCVGCHTASYDGSRISYVVPSASGHWGTSRWSDAAPRFDPAVAPAATSPGGPGAFQPDEANAPPALLMTTHDAATRTVTLELVDPDTGAPVASDLDALIAAIDPAIGRSVVAPAWSPTGRFIVFAAYDELTHPALGVTFGAPHGTLFQAAVEYQPAQGRFHFGAPVALVEPPIDPAAQQQNVGPAISPDGDLIAFTQGTATRTSTIESVLLIAVDRDRQPLVIQGGAGDPAGAWRMHSGAWAPSRGKRWAWLVMSSNRAYPHDRANGGPHGQLWISAIDRTALGVRSVDPSHPPWHLTGQKPQRSYVRPQWPSPR